jgi:YegS/Rv2252/BmrU family lipid kinase
MKAALIVNPYSGGGRTARMWKTIRPEVQTRLGELQVFETTGPGDATRFASQIAQDHSTELLVIAGGDGTINEVVNGLMGDDHLPINPELKIGIMSAGRGCDFIRSLDVPNDYRAAMDLLVDPRTRPVDVGCGVFKDEFGREQRRYFMNIASAGLAGLVARRVLHAPRFLAPELTYFGAVATSFIGAKGQVVKVIVDDKVVFDGPAINVFVCNGSYSGAGMCWAPMAKLDDGVFEVVIGEPIPKYKLLTSGHKLYDGSFLTIPGVHHFSGKQVLIDTKDDVFLEVDGEQPGVAPVIFTIVPKALQFVVGSNGT